ncbi:MAG: hypothetical protein JWM78_3481 [Verrucomicrobiaceae bacterium]|nr:hypothetical protein [Verrucomicrobiaceae bacterium]
MSPLATQDQKEVESLALRLIEAPAVRAAREVGRQQLLADPAIKLNSGRLGLERALDQWTLALAMREANSDRARPKIIWNVDNTPRRWFGHIYTGAAVAVDNPDNANRDIPIDGDSEYEILGRFDSNRSANFSLKLEDELDDHAGIGPHRFMLTSQQIVTDANGHFRITVSKESAEGRTNHIQTLPGNLTLYARDSLADWSQSPTALSIRRTAGAIAPPPRTESELIARVAQFLPTFIRFWAGFKDTFLGYPTPNAVVGPIGREASWGFLAGGRYQLSDDQALVITITDGGAAYTGFQVTDPWTIAPDPLYRQSSLNRTQRAVNNDGSITYVVATRDPGVHNWIDSVGLHEGWFLLRWQGLPNGTSGDGLIRDCRAVKVADLEQYLPAGCPRVDLAERRAAIAVRAGLYATRHAEHVAT